MCSMGIRKIIRLVVGIAIIFMTAYKCKAIGMQGQSENICRKRYSGIRPDDKDGRKGLLNPERGFRWENRIGSFKDKWKASNWIGAIKSHKDDGITMTQAYCELLDYCELMRIPKEKIRKLEEDFVAVRQAGIKLILCFRYEMNVKDNKGPTLEIILSHIKQLKPILRANMDIIAVLQTGFIGLYGEWHRSYHGLDKNPEAQEKVLSALLDLLPMDRKLVIRYPRHKNMFVMRVGHRKSYQAITAAEAQTSEPAARIGFCDHGFMVGKNDAGTFAPRPSVDYDYMTRESLFLPMDGELFWAWSRPSGVKKDDGLEAIRRLWEHHYTFFSYAHNHTVYEGTWAIKKYGARFSIDEWKKEIVTPEFLRKNHLPISDGYFEDAKGKYVERTIFEYIRDHLGYRLELRGAEYAECVSKDKKFDVMIRLVNRGFAAPINPRVMYLVLIDRNKNVYIVSQSDTDIRKFYPCKPEHRQRLAPEYKIRFAVNSESLSNLPRGFYKIGIWLPDKYESIRYDARYAIRFANRDVDWWVDGQGRYGINVIGELELK